MSALAGSAIGALASLATAWLTQHSQTRVTQRLQDPARCEAVHGEFIREASKLFAAAFEHGLGDPPKLVGLHATVDTIRLFGRPRTVEEAERVVNRICAANFAPNKELRLFADIAKGAELDPLCAFSDACREELKLAPAAGGAPALALRLDRTGGSSELRTPDLAAPGRGGQGAAERSPVPRHVHGQRAALLDEYPRQNQRNTKVAARSSGQPSGILHHR
jgi:hypothetical protein